MTNFDTARDALETSLNSAGSAMKEHEKWQQSLEAQINKLKASWQGLSQAFLSSDFLHGALDFVIKLVDGITLLIDKVGVLPTLFTGFSLFKSFGNKGLFKTINNELDGFINKIGIANKSFADLSNAFNFGATGKGLKGFISGLSAMKNSLSTTLTDKDLSNIRAYNDLLDQGVSSQTAWYRTMQSSSGAAQDLVQSANGSKVALNGMKTASVGVKAGLIGAKVAAVAFNAALTIGISLLIDWAISGIMKLVNAKKELAEEVDEITSKFKEQSNELQKLKGDYDTSNESSMISKYEKLSKGVDNLGRNVSLTTDEYSEYQNIVNQIAEQFPTLISGYDSQGNALLSCKDNVEELTKAYEELIKAQNREVFNNVENIGKDFKNDIKDFEDSGWFNKEMTSETIGDLQELVNNGYMETDEISKFFHDKYGNNSPYFKQIKEALDKAGVELEGSFWNDTDRTRISKTLSKVLKTDPDIVKNIIADFESNLEVATEGMRSIAQATLSDAFDIRSSDYYGMSDTMKSVVRNIVNSFDYEFYKDYADNPLGVKTYINDMLDDLNSLNDTDGATIEAAFDLQTQFNGSEISYGDYVKGLENTGKTIDKLVSSGKLEKEIGTQIKLSIGLDEEGIVKEYDVLLKKLSEDSDTYDFNITEEQAKKFLDGLSSEELAIAVDVITEMQENGAEETIEEVRNAIDRQLAINGLTLELDIEVEKTKLEALTTALTESFSGSGLSSESISAVEGMFSNLSSYDPAKLFERTANGIKLNNDELRKLNNESKKTNIAKINKEMDSLGDIYNQTREELYTLTYGTEEYNKKAAELKGIEDRIKATEKLASQYEGLASAYQEWQMAESSGSERGMYEGLLEGWENVGDELSRGWVDDGTREFIELLKGETTTIIDGNGVKKEINIATASAKELKRVWKDLDKNIQHTAYSVHDFFTVDDEGNSTSKGVYNFLDAIGQMEEEKFNSKDVVKRDKNGNIISFDFQLVGGDKAIAEALGVSEELVQIMKRAAADAGFVVSFDGTYQQLDILREKAQKASETLNKVLKEKGQGDKVFSYNFNSNDEKDITKQLENANKALNTFKKSGKVDLSIEGAEEALTVASTLQSMLDRLQRPTYMQIEVSEVEKNLQEPLRNLQELRTLTETEHQFKISGTDTTELEASKQDIYNYFETLDPKVKAELGLVDDKGNPLTGQALQDKLNSGEIAIEATVDIQMNMDEKLGVLVDKALYDAGIIDKKEFEKRVNVYLKADEVDDSDVDDKVEETFEEGNGKKPVVEKEVEIEIVEDVNDKKELDDLINNVNPDPIKKKVIVEYFTDHSEVDDYTPNQKKALVEFIANTDSLDEYTPEEKQAIVEYLTNSADPDSWTPEQKEAVAKFIRESSDVDSYTPDQKKAIAKFIKDSIEPDSYTPPSPTSTVTFNKDTTNVDTYDPPNFTRYVTYYAKKAFSNAAEKGKKVLEDRFGIVNGTANVNGTAFKQGSWGTKNSGTALVGELGREVLVRNGRYYTIGDSGAEFIKYKKGDIIFNHVQSEQLFRNGKVTAGGGRAKALANGTAFTQGTAFNNGYDGKESYNVGDNDKDKTEETFDWIETLISRLERTIDNLDQTVNNVYKSWGERNIALSDEIDKVSEEITLQKNAAKEYLDKANTVGLDSAYIEKIQDGKLNIQDFEGENDEALVEKIKEYQKWYELYLDCTDAAEDLEQTEAELYEQRFENIQAQYDGIIQGFEHTESMLEEYISQAEAKGHIVSKNYYKALIDNEKAKMVQLRNEQSELITARDALTPYTQAWYDMCAEIDSVTQAIEEGNTALIEYSNSMRDIDWEVFDLIQERISDVTDEANFLIDLMSYDKLFDDNGKLTDKGMATMGLHSQNYNTYMHQADTYADEIDELNRQIDALGEDDYDLNLINRRNELLELQRESILAAEDEKQAIKDLVEEGINLELEALQERIDLHNEELDSMKNLYDYQKNVQEQTENIASLQKQLRAYEGFDDEETRATVQKLKVELESAQQDLQETEYDKFISDQSALLDELYLEYETILNERLDNLDGLITECFATVNEKADTINTTISGVVEDVGVELSEELSNIWSGENGIQNVVTTYGEGFKGQLTSIKTTLDGIKSGITTMVNASNKEADTKVEQPKTTTSAKTDPTSSSGSGSGNNSSSAGNKSTGDGKVKIGDKVKFLSGKYYYDSQGVNPAGSKNHGKQVYITNINKKSWATHPYHISTGKKLGSGDLGWLKLNQISGYATGKKNFLNNEIAWTQENGKEFIVRPSDGAILTPIAKGDSVLNAKASGNIWNMANNPAEFIKDSLKLDTANVPNGSSVQNNITQNLDKVVFNLPNVRNYEQLLSEMQKDKNFERLITSMTVDQIAGKSSLAKNKSIR